MTKQTSIQMSNRCKSEIEQLALLWGYPEVRHITPVVERAVHFAWMIFIGYSQSLDRWQEMLDVWKSDDLAS